MDFTWNLMRLVVEFRQGSSTIHKRGLLLMFEEKKGWKGVMPRKPEKLISTFENSPPMVSKTTPGWRKHGDKDKLWCNYCNKRQHTNEMCWKLHGRPQSETKSAQKETGNSHEAKTGQTQLLLRNPKRPYWTKMTLISWRSSWWSLRIKTQPQVFVPWLRQVVSLP